MRMGRTFAVAGAAVLGVALAAAAQEPSTGRGPDGARRGMREARGHRLADYLGLDAPQQAAVQNLRQQQRDEMKPLWDESRALRRKLREATEAEKPDALAVGEATLALKAHRDKVKAQHAAFEQKLVALFTPEQKQKYEALKAARDFGRGGPGAERRYGRGAGPRGRI
jgi:Spy/CpxP family protein refolding chaperone